MVFLSSLWFHDSGALMVFPYLTCLMNGLLVCVSSFFPYIYIERERGYPLISLWASKTNPPVLGTVHSRSLNPFNK